MIKESEPIMTLQKECPTQDLPAAPVSHSRRERLHEWFWRQARKIVVLVVGLTVVLIGLAGLMLPVLPGWVLIFVGLFILGSEFAWARWVLKVAKERGGHLVDAAKNHLSGNSSTDKSSPGGSPKR